MPRVVLIGDLDPPRGPLALLEEIRADLAQRAWNPSLGAIVLSRSGSELDVLRAFDAGADDALPRRAGYLELRARLLALTRRLDDGIAPSPLVTVGALAIDTATHAVTLGGHAVDLRRLEFALLVHLAGDPERVFAKQELLTAVWGYRCCAVTTRTVESHASRLRRKLESHGAGRWVVNVWGVGYRLI
ncbi:MAG TPA: response regulator transcription factor [Solirubrobacteraceae bacterium]|jgi:DNA-binding response OmpR family regulator|nr:response regulator transcription factor [Solirubrobacteraceae bacterium]